MLRGRSFFALAPAPLELNTYYIQTCSTHTRAHTHMHTHTHTHTHTHRTNEYSMAWNSLLRGRSLGALAPAPPSRTEYILYTHAVHTHAVHTHTHTHRTNEYSRAWNSLLRGRSFFALAPAPLELNTYYIHTCSTHTCSTHTRTHTHTHAHAHTGQTSTVGRGTLCCVGAAWVHWHQRLPPKQLLLWKRRNQGCVMSAVCECGCGCG